MLYLQQILLACWQVGLCNECLKLRDTISALNFVVGRGSEPLVKDGA